MIAHLFNFKASLNDKLTLKELDEDVVADSQKLLGVSEDMIKILETVSKCLPIIQWLRQNLNGLFLYVNINNI